VPKSLTQPTQNYESRQFARALKHPSGERPRDPDRVVIGATIRNAGIPSATVDEIVFGSTLFGNSGATQGGNLMLTEAFGDGQQTLKLARGTLRHRVGALLDSQQLPAAADAGRGDCSGSAARSSATARSTTRPAH
jgi:hypothetical protein